MKKRIRSARVFTIGFIGEAEVNEGAGDCLALGVGTFGETVAVIEQHNSAVLNMLRNEMDANPLGYVNVIMLTGENVTEKKSVDAVRQLAGRQVDTVLRGIFSVRYLDKDETQINVKTTKRGQIFIDKQERYESVPNRTFHCLSCRNADNHRLVTSVQGATYAKIVDLTDMEEVKVDGRTMTIAPCPDCDSVMTRTGGINTKRENHCGLSERRLFFEAPEQAYCLSCRQNVKMIWIKAIRKSDEQPRPSYRGNCFRCLGMVGTPWHRTKLVPIKATTLEKLVENAKHGEDTLYERRMVEAEKRHECKRRENEVNEARRMRDAMAAFKLRYKVA